jgi:hypothetical protein
MVAEVMKAAGAGWWWQMRQRIQIAVKTPLRIYPMSARTINTAMKKQSWYVVLYQQLRVFHKRTKLVYC